MIRRLTLIRLPVSRARTKFKLGQQRPAHIRERVIAELRQRNRHADGMAADAVSRTLIP
jgi:predicted FMN-binding regulatory protein PaiB